MKMMMREIRTSGTEILDCLLYEQELNINKDLYAKEKMEFLVDAIEKNRCLRIITKPYDNYLNLLLLKNYKISAVAKELSMNENNLERFLKKVQKHLEIYYLRRYGITEEYLNVFTDSKIKRIDGEYCISLDFSREIRECKSQLEEDNERHIKYNTDLAFAKKSIHPIEKFTSNADFVNFLKMNLDNQICLYTYEKFIEYSNSNNEQISKVYYKILHKKIMNRIYRKVEDVEDTIDARTKMFTMRINRLNDVYGFKLYKIK